MGSSPSTTPPRRTTGCSPSRPRDSTTQDKYNNHHPQPQQEEQQGVLDLEKQHNTIQYIQHNIHNTITQVTTPPSRTTGCSPSKNNGRHVIKREPRQKKNKKNNITVCVAFSL